MTYTDAGPMVNTPQASTVSVNLDPAGLTASVASVRYDGLPSWPGQQPPSCGRPVGARRQDHGSLPHGEHGLPVCGDCAGLVRIVSNLGTVGYQSYSP